MGLGRRRCGCTCWASGVVDFVLVLLDDNRHAQQGQARLRLCRTAEDVGVPAGVRRLASVHRRQTLPTSILVLILLEHC